MDSLHDITQKIYQDLFYDNSKEVTLGIASLNEHLQRIKEKSMILEFSDWESYHDIEKSDYDWIRAFTYRLIRRSIQFDLSECFEALFHLYDFDNNEFLELVDIGIENTSLKCMDILIQSLPHPDFVLSREAVTLFTRVAMFGNKTLLNHLYLNYNCNPDGMKVIDSHGTKVDYSHVLFTTDYGSILIYVMISPYLSDFQKLDMMNYLITTMGTDIHGYPSDLFDTPMQVSASLHEDFLSYFIESGITPSEKDLFSAVSSKAKFDRKKEILDLLFDNFSFDANLISEETGHSLIEWTVLMNGTDALQTIQYLIDRGAEYEINGLLCIAQEGRHYSLRDALFLAYGGSETILTILLIDEEELFRKEFEAREDDEPNIWVFYPEKAY